MYFRYEDAGQRENRNCASVLDVWNELFALWGRVEKQTRCLKFNRARRCLRRGKEKRERSGERLMIL